MQMQVTPPPEEQPASKMKSLALIKLLIARHPYITSLFFLIYWLAMSALIGRLILGPLDQATKLAYLPYETIGECFLVLLVIFPLVVLKWWSETGFTRGINGWGVLICLLPILFVAGPAFLSLSLLKNAPLFIVLNGILLSLLVGFAEEGMFRGLLIRTLLPRGIWPSVLISSVCFAAIHLTNLLSAANWDYVSGQIILALGMGTLMAALRLRTGSIWPGILIHAGRDVVGLIYLGINPAFMQQSTSSLVAIIVNVVFSLIYLTIAVVLLRPSQVRKLEVIYGLKPAPVMPPAYAAYPGGFYIHPGAQWPGYTQPMPPAGQPWQGNPAPGPLPPSTPLPYPPGPSEQIYHQPVPSTPVPPAPEKNDQPVPSYVDYTSPETYRERPHQES